MEGTSGLGYTLKNHPIRIIFQNQIPVEGFVPWVGHGSFLYQMLD
jgi:hypothetical protein